MSMGLVVFILLPPPPPPPRGGWFNGSSVANPKSLIFEARIFVQGHLPLHEYKECENKKKIRNMGYVNSVSKVIILRYFLTYM